MTTPNPAIEPFSSLAVLREAHKNLQNELANESAVLRSVEDVALFVRRAVLTGATLDVNDDRKSAQSVINYWVSRVGTAVAKGDSSLNNPFADSEFDSLLAEFDTKTIGQATAEAQNWVKSISPADATLVRRVLLRMVRLGADNQTVLTPVRRESLDDLEPRERVDALLDDLVRLGVVRRTSCIDQGAEFGLRSSELLESWAFLKDALEMRKKLRARAETWHAQAKHLSRSEQFRRAAHAWLIGVGRKVDNVWDGIIRLFGGQRHLVPDPAVELPDVDYYRDRTQTEIDYLFRRRADAKEGQDWVRVMKGLAALAALAALTVGILIYYTEAEATRLELKQRRARQRLKEHIALIRQLAQFHQYNGQAPNQSRADVAKWRIESPIDRAEGDQQEYERELELLDVNFDVENGKICVDCSAKPISVAKKLRSELMDPRVNANNPQYDNDTVTYRQGLIRNRYDVALKIATAIHDGLKETQADAAAQDYNALAGYMEEFWILYYGEMVVVESPDVEAAMVEFGKALLEVDSVFGKLLADKLIAVDKANGEKLKRLGQSNIWSPDLQPQNVVAQTDILRSKVDSQKWSAELDSFRKKPLQDLRAELEQDESKRREFTTALRGLNSSFERLIKELSHELRSTEER
jgi:hypothetical protein